MRRCLECNRLTGDHRRGLCRRCYRDISVRDGYNLRPRGLWGKNGFACWGIDEESLLIDLFGKGLSDRDIAVVMNRTLWAVTKKRQRLGLTISQERRSANLRRGHVTCECSSQDTSDL